MENTVSSNERSSVKKPAKKSSEDRPNKSRIIAIIVVAVLLVGGLTAGVVYLLTHQEKTTVVSSDDNSGAASTALSDGKNSIKSGGTYTFTGSTGNGKIEVDTSDDVKIILNNVSITNTSGAAIKSKGTGKLTIELVGSNTLITTDKTVDDPASAISGDADLEITGSGFATLKANGKGIKADGTLTLTSGILSITSTDDTIHSNTNVSVSGGEYTLNTGDDAIHADGTLSVTDGKIIIEKSSEGLEANIVNISGGEISVVASDDGINAQNSNGTSRVGVAGDGQLIISGGKIHVDAGGDGLDSNGSIAISGGEIYVDGPTSNGDGAIDCDGEISITGGTLVAVGSSGMAQNATSATQPSVLINLSASQSGELSFGGITYAPSKRYQSVLISSPKLKVGESYELVIGGSTVQSVTISQNITGEGTGMMGGGMPGGGGNMGGQAPQGGQQMQNGGMRR